MIMGHTVHRIPFPVLGVCFLIISFENAAFGRTQVVQLRALKEQKDLVNDHSQFYKNWSKQFRDLMKHHEQQYGIKQDTVRTIFGLCSTPKHNWPSALESSSFTIDRPEFCRVRPRVRYLIAVHSHSKSRHRRDLIRSTWASLRRVGGERIATLFFLGRAENKQGQEDINQESAQYQDIIQRNFTEHYHNMTRKHLTVMEWVSKGYCESLEYLIKVDDDTFVDVFHLVRFLKTERLKTPNSFYCSATSGARPIRPSKKTPSKWVITTTEFEKSVFPTYCEGLGYIIEAHLAPYLYWCSLFTPPIWIDDVYVTGILAENLGFQLQEFIPGHAYSRVGPSKQNEHLLDSIFLTSYHSEFLPETFRRLWQTAVSRSMDIF
ncbi:Hexosyltransferase [Fasciola hepatica]|uniref:Hexosyltransferase n=1 Tax=Fasciola hepatica TaxID=6192 RepID=A0A4E0REC1_FASHE|nr:Hexosyltransferase [Fasciola hepatica]